MRHHLIVAAIALLFSTIGMAKTITLYDQPKADAKNVGTIDLDSGLIPIFTPKDNKEWVKVADPKNGNVGWVKNTDLKGSTAESSFTYTQKMISNGKSPQGYIVQYGVPQPLTPEQSQALFKQMQLHEKAIQDDINHMMHDMYDNAHGWGGYPMMMPIIVMPQPMDNKMMKPAPAAVK